MIRTIAKMDLERFGKVIFKKGNKYNFKEKLSPEGKEYYSILTSTGQVDFYEKDLHKFFVIDNSIENLDTDTETKKEG